MVFLTLCLFSYWQGIKVIFYFKNIPHYDTLDLFLTETTHSTFLGIAVKARTSREICSVSAISLSLIRSFVCHIRDDARILVSGKKPDVGSYMRLALAVQKTSLLA